MPLLTVYTPTYKRPLALENCIASVQAQTDPDWEMVIIPDEVGLGIDGMYADIRNHTDKITGDYVLVLSDDDLLVDPDFVAGLREQVGVFGQAQVIVFKSIKSGRVLPTHWQDAPQSGHIDLSNFVVRSDVWKANAAKWGVCYEGDYYFIRSLWDQGIPFEWWDRHAVEAQRISRGLPE